MRSVFWLLGLAAMAVALALLMGRNQAVVTLMWAPHRFDTSFNLVLFALIAGFVLVYMALRTLSLLRELPRQAQRWRHQQTERAAVGAVMDALSNQLAGRFVRAQAAAVSALKHLNDLPAARWERRDHLGLLAHLLAAESAQSLQNRELRDEHLQAALSPALAKALPDAHEGALLRAVHWSVEDRDADGARERLAALPQGASRRIQALRLRLRASRLGGSSSEALDTARLLAKHRAFSPAASQSIVRGLVLAVLREAHDAAQLRSLWASLDAGERAMPELALAASQRLNELAHTEYVAPSLASHAPQQEPATDAPDSGFSAADLRQRAASQALVREWLEPLWNRFDTLSTDQQQQMALALEPGLPSLGSAWLAQLEQAQRRMPNNACLQYLAGQACMQRQLWGKAAQLLVQASHSLRHTGMLRRTWCSLALLAEERGDNTAAQMAWKTAATVASAGGE